MKRELYKLEIFIPDSHFQALRQALWSVDTGHIGRYDRCMSWSQVNSCWRPLDGTTPYNGTVGELCQAQELKVEVCCVAQRLQETLSAIKAAHPYEEPVINILPLVETSL